MDDIIQVRDLVKRYGELAAVDGVDLSVPAGAFYGVLGPNGAGKTTLLEMIEGIRQPDAGTVQILGEPVWPRNQNVLRKIGVQFQASAFFPKLTVREQIDTFAALYGIDPETSLELLEQFGLADKQKTLTEDLSGGQQQRLSIACSLVHDPQIVFLDEPTAALDPQARRNLWDALRALHERGRTVVLTTHYMEEAESLCDIISVMDHGRILTTGSPRDLVAGIDTPHRISIDATAIPAQEAAAIEGVDNLERDRDAIVMSTRVPAQVLGELAERHALDGVSVRGATLEDVFLQLTGREYRA